MRKPKITRGRTTKFVKTIEAKVEAVAFLLSENKPDLASVILEDVRHAIGGFKAIHGL